MDHIELLKRNRIFQTIVCRVHVGFPGRNALFQAVLQVGSRTSVDISCVAITGKIRWTCKCSSQKSFFVEHPYMSTIGKLVVWIPRIPLWKGVLLRGTLIRIPNHRAPNHQSTICWTCPFKRWFFAPWKQLRPGMLVALRADLLWRRFASSDI